MKYTDEQLRAMPMDKFLNLRDNAIRVGGEAGNALLAQIDAIERPLPTGGMPKNHPIYRELEDLIKGAEGRALALGAAEQGLSPMSKIDPFLQERIGKRYNRDQQITNTAGSLVGELMRESGYEKDRDSAPLPEGCVAKTAATWKLRKPLK